MPNSTRQLKNGKVVMDVESDKTFSVDPEGAVMAIDYEIDSIMEMHRTANDKTGLTRGYRWWARMGIIALAPQQVNIHDEILRRSEIKERLGIAGPDVDLDYLLSLTKSAEETTKAHEQPSESATEFNRESQLDLFSAFAIDNVSLAA